MNSKRLIKDFEKRYEEEKFEKVVKFNTHPSDFKNVILMGVVNSIGFLCALIGLEKSVGYPIWIANNLYWIVLWFGRKVYWRKVK